MVLELKDYGIVPIIVDPVADPEEAHEEYGLTFATKEDLKDLDALIIAVSHDEFKSWSKDIPSFFNTQKTTPIIFDLKALYDRYDLTINPLTYWRL
jgi:UDP-N-acetyl-D-galactosamine dehydrogenase